MKNILSIVLFVLSLSAFSQTSISDIPKGKLFTVDEIARIQVSYHERANEMKLTEEQYYEYSTIIDNNFYYMGQFNKNQNRTKDEMIAYVDKRVAGQNKELKKFLTTDQYNKHIEIYQTVILTPVMNRINLLFPE
jgi:hypothetical protein